MITHDLITGYCTYCRQLLTIHIQKEDGEDISFIIEHDRWCLAPALPEGTVMITLK